MLPDARQASQATTWEDRNDWLFDVIWQLTDHCEEAELPLLAAKLEEALDAYLLERARWEVRTGVFVSSRARGAPAADPPLALPPPPAAGPAPCPGPGAEAEADLDAGPPPPSRAAGERLFHWRALGRSIGLARPAPGHAGACDPQQAHRISMR